MLQFLEFESSFSNEASPAAQLTGQRVAMLLENDEVEHQPKLASCAQVKEDSHWSEPSLSWQLEVGAVVGDAVG